MYGTSAWRFRAGCPLGDDPAGLMTPAEYTQPCEVLFDQLIVVEDTPGSVDAAYVIVPADEIAFSREVWSAPTESVPLCVIHRASTTISSVPEEATTEGVVLVPLPETYPAIGVV